MAAILNTIAGGNPLMVTDHPLFKPGTVATSDVGNSYIYAGPAGGAIAKGAKCTVNATTFALEVDTTSGAHTAPAAIASGDYAWVAQGTPPF